MAAGAGVSVVRAAAAAAAAAVFRYEHVPPLQWFPGHMAAGLRAMRERLASVDVIVEVRDARVRPSCACPCACAYGAACACVSMPVPTRLPSFRGRQVPLSSANPELDALGRQHERIVVYTKADLANPNMHSVRARGPCGPLPCLSGRVCVWPYAEATAAAVDRHGAC
jgi:hypothetical protein